MLEIENVWFKYSVDWILRGINLKIDKGINCIIGKNGSGKTTLLRVIIGALKPQRGFVRVAGHKISNMKSASRYMVYLPSNPTNFFVGPKIIDEINRLGLDMYSLPTFIKNLLSKGIFQLSEGQRRLVAIYLAINYSKEIVIMDEPTVGLDMKFRKIFLDMMVNNPEKTFVIATNDIRLTLMCDKVAVIDHGTIISFGCPMEVIDKAYLVPQIDKTILEIRKLDPKIRNLRDLIAILRRCV